MAQSTAKPPARTRKRPPNLVQMPQTDGPPPVFPAPAEPPDPAAAPEAAPTPPAAPPTPVTSAKPFPPAPRGSGKGGYCKDADGMAYWRSLPPEFVNRTNAYVNREWPVLDRLQELSPEERVEVNAKRRREPFKYIDKPPDAFGPDWKLDILQRYGSGTYKFYINDAGVRGAKGDPELQPHTLCKFLVTVNDSDFPPVLDPGRPDKGLAILDLKHPHNASYVSELRTRGILPLEDGEIMQAAGSQVVKDLADRVGTLANQVAQGKQDELLRELRERGTGGVDVTQLLIAMLTRPQPAPADTGTSATIQLFQTTINGLQTELREERAERRKHEESLRARAEQPPPDPFAYFERMVSTVEKAKQFFNNPASNGGVAETVVKHASRMSGTLEFLSDVIPKIIDAPILKAIAERMAVGNAIAANPAGAQGRGNSDEELLKFVQEVITPAMLNYLESDNNGGDFAEWVYCGYPDKLQELQTRGPNTIIVTYQNSRLWPRLMPREMQFRRFVQQFCTWKPATPADEVAHAAPPDLDNPDYIEETPEGPTSPIDFDAMMDAELEGAPLV